jgi:hypothetical protein
VIVYLAFGLHVEVSASDRCPQSLAQVSAAINVDQILAIVRRAFSAPDDGRVQGRIALQIMKYCLFHNLSARDKQLVWEAIAERLRALHSGEWISVRMELGETTVFVGRETHNRPWMPVLAIFSDGALRYGVWRDEFSGSPESLTTLTILPREGLAELERLLKSTGVADEGRDLK